MDLCKTYHDLSHSYKVQFFEILFKLCQSRSLTSCDCQTFLTDDILVNDALNNLLNSLRKGAGEASQCIDFLCKSFDCESRNQKTLDNWVLKKKIKVPTVSLSPDIDSNLTANESGNKRSLSRKKRKLISGNCKQRGVRAISKTTLQNDVPESDIIDSGMKLANKQTSPALETLSSLNINEKFSSPTQVTSESISRCDIHYSVSKSLSPIVRLIELPLFNTALQNQACSEYLTIRKESNADISSSELQNPCVSAVSKVSDSVSKMCINSNSSVTNSERESPVILSQTSKEGFTKNRKELKMIEVTKANSENSSADLKTSDVISPYNLRRKRGNVSDSKACAETKSAPVNVTSYKSGTQECETNANTETEECETSTDASEENEMILNTGIKTGTEIEKSLSLSISSNKSGKIKCNKSSKTTQIEVIAENVGENNKLDNETAQNVRVAGESVLGDSMDSENQKSPEQRRGTIKYSIDPSLQHKYEAYCKVKHACSSIGLNISDIFQSKEIDNLMKNLKELQSDGIVFLGTHKMQSTPKTVPIIHVHESEKKLFQILSKIKNGK